MRRCGGQGSGWGFRPPVRQQARVPLALAAASRLPAAPNPASRQHQDPALAGTGANACRVSRPTCINGGVQAHWQAMTQTYTPGSHDRAVMASPGAPTCSAMAGLCTLPSCWRMPVVLKTSTAPSEPAVACIMPQS